MHIDRGRLNWGVFFIALGAVPIAVHVGAISQSAVGEAWRLWPLIIVGIGLGIVLSRTPAYFVGGLFVAACIGLVFGSVFAAGVNVGCGDTSASPTVTRDGTFAGTGRVELRLSCGSATVNTASGSAWHVSAGTSGGASPNISADASSLTVQSDNANWWFDRGKENWQVTLPTDQRLALTVTVDAGDAHFSMAGARNLDSASFTLNAGSLHMDLSGAQVGELSVSTNLGSASLILDAGSDVSGSVTTNLGSFDVCAPASLGLRISESASLGGSNLDHSGLVRVGDSWQTPGYDSAAHKANLSATTNLGGLTLNPAGGCK